MVTLCIKMGEMKERLSERNREILQQYETVRTWINKKCGSWETAKYYIPNLMKFCKLHNTNPNEIVREWKRIRKKEETAKEKINKIFIEQNGIELEVFIPMYEPLEVTNEKRGGKCFTGLLVVVLFSLLRYRSIPTTPT